MSYTISDIDQFYKNVNTFKESITEPITIRDFWLEMMSFNSKLSDGHLSISPLKIRDVARKYIAGGGMLFPFKVAFREGDLLIQSKLNGESSALAGYKISRINDMNISKVLLPLLKRTNGDTKHIKKLF